MSMIQSQQDISLIQEIRKLHFNFEIETGKKRCEEILSQSPHLYQIRTYYGFFLIYYDIVKSLEQQIQVFRENPYYFENTSYMLDNIQSSFQKKGRDVVKVVQEQYINYQGEKDGFYYICLALIYRMSEDHEKSFSILTQNINNYLEQNEILCWFYHQIGCHFQSLTQYGQDETEENVQNTIKYFTKAMEIQPRNTMNIQNIGVQYHRVSTQESNHKAIEYFCKSLQINPNDHYSICNLSNVYNDLQQYQKSFELLKYCFTNLKFNFTLFQYQYLLFAHFDDLNVDIDQEIVAVSKGLEKIINIEAANNMCYNCYQNLYILTIQHKRQLKYIDIFVKITELFRTNDISSLFGLADNLKIDEEMDLYEIQKITKTILKKEIFITSQLLFTIVYQRFIQQEINFQQNFSHWDLYFE